MHNEPLYESKSTVKSLWQKYLIFDDRVEFKTLLGTMTIPFENIESFEKNRSDVKSLLHGNLGLKNFRPALKLDFANFTDHITIDRTDGAIHRILFAPEDADEFFAVLERAVERYKGTKVNVQPR